ncbi:MAG: RbsD/FucU family protein [Rhizobiaceae bacterium]|nr:RbsD/FucU family protein [Rhizobiaceae bacterium]
MLKNIDPLLSADLLFALRSMGHGDDIIIGDANFPGDAIARETTFGRVIRTDCVSTAEIVKAILSVMPLDNFVEDAAGRMQLVHAADEIPPVQQEVQDAIDASEKDAPKLLAIERFAFYKRAKQAYCVIQTGERRPYGCIALRKGVVGPDG